MDSDRYTARDLKGDLVAGLFNGGIFGLVYSFYFLPLDRLDAKLFGRCRNNVWLYFASNAIRMGAGFALMRSTYNWTKKDELEKEYQVASCVVAFGAALMIM